MIKEIRFVFYVEKSGLRPALVVDEFGKRDITESGERKEPDLALCVFVPKMHLPAYSIDRAKHGTKVGEYMLPHEVEEDEEVEEIKPEVPVINFDLGSEVKAEPKLADEKKEEKAKEPKAPKAKKGEQAPDAELGKAQQVEAEGEGSSEPSA
ncbi:MAG TPA: hypothetical protein EYN91_25390 [Candidatus Melainabacteria bacterium]|jgi:type IV secretory pathway VirB10-like protein|nr:hypothetical protein [Candidatus Melainabacteria bacterium]